MVYRSPAPRHAAVPLRLGAAGTDAVVESLPVHCTHHDAFRFFTPPARPRNAVAPDAGRPGRSTSSPAACTRPWTSTSGPTSSPPPPRATWWPTASSSPRDVRELDMRASPYDLTALGYPPVPIETPAGRAAYARAQAGFARRAAPLRDRLATDLCRPPSYNGAITGSG